MKMYSIDLEKRIEQKRKSIDAILANDPLKVSSICSGDLKVNHKDVDYCPSGKNCQYKQYDEHISLSLNKEKDIFMYRCKNYSNKKVK